VLYERGQPLVVEEIEVDPPKRDEVRVRVVASGVCGSDVHVAGGRVSPHLPTKLPMVLGHEGAGIVESVGEGVTHVVPGDHVVLSWLAACGTCRFCVAGRPTVCADTSWFESTMQDGTVRFSHDGVRIHNLATATFANYTVVPARTAIKVDDSLPLEELALIGCAVMTGVGAVFNTARVRPGESVAVIGCGGIGLSVVQGAAIAGAGPIIAVDISETKLELAREIGATHTVDGTSVDPAAAIHQICGGADHVFEALGRTETIEQAVRSTGRGGETIVIGASAPGATAAIDTHSLMLEQRSIRGSFYGSARPEIDFPMLVGLVKSGRLRLDLLIERCRLDDVNEVLATIAQGAPARFVIVHE